MQDKVKPAGKITLHFPIVGTIWRNENTSTATGEVRAWYSATVERRYKDRDGNHQNTGSMSGEELLIAAEVARLAYSKIARLREADRATQGNERNAGQEG